MFTVFKQLASGEMVLFSTHDTYALAELAAQAAATESSGLVQIEADTDGGSRILSTFGAPSGA